jgi:hypothetical protein
MLNSIGIKRAKLTSGAILLPMILLGMADRVSRLNAQVTTATILGTVTDASGAAIPESVVQVRNIGTGAAQTAVSDSEGRYRVSDLGIGDYELRSSKEGFATVVRRGITLTVGSQNVVDFSLTVGQQQQTINVEAQTSQVETTNATVGALVDQAQMRELPLNGRNFEQLMQLAPGVQNYSAGSVNANARAGRDPAISVAGSRPNGFALLVDDQSLETFYNRGLGSVTGTSLGVEAIAEFQTLTNTYGAQFGGFGAVMNAVSKSGTNSFHGSMYEFLRNSALDARNFNDPSEVPAFRRNQFGGTLGGPVKKDRAFFFFNYEGIRQVQGQSQIATVPLSRTSTSTDPTVAASVNAVLALYPQPQFNINPAAGTGQATVVKKQAAEENYYLGRFDYNLSSKDSFLARYFIDKQNAFYPFFGGAVGLWGERDLGSNQFANVEERHIFSPSVVNIARASFSRTNVGSPLGETHQALQFFPGAGRADGTITASPLSTIGVAQSTSAPQGQLQNRFGGSDDLAWTHGAHSLRFGASLERIQSHVLWPWQNGSTWAFSSIPLLLAGTARQVTAIRNTPDNNPVRDFRQTELAFYGQDDWKVTPKLTLNLGLRYSPATNPNELHNNLFTITNYRTDSGFTNVSNVTATNSSLRNFDPRIGFAYDLFADHRTSIRGGFGMFHQVIYAGIYAIGYINSPPWKVITQTSPTNAVIFQNPSYGGAPVLSTGGVPAVPSVSAGNAWQIDRNPYMTQYNLNIQREIVQGTVLTVGYIGSHGVNLTTGLELNPVPAAIDANGVYHFAPTSTGSQRTNPALGSFTLGINGTTSRYNSVQASVNRRLTKNVQAQIAYTYSRCMSTGDASGVQSLSANAPITNENPYNREYDRSVCAFNVTQALTVNSLLALPFRGNRLIEGWQISGILATNTGLPFNITNGANGTADISNQINGVSRPDYAPNSPAATIRGISYPACNNHPILGGATMYFNPTCFSQEAFGTLGNFGREGLTGPRLFNLDLALLKSTRIRESLNLQFRAEVFNILNHTNLGLPGAGGNASPIFTGTATPTAVLARVPTAGQITSFAVPSREIQLGLKLIF